MNLLSRAKIKEILEKNDIKPNKSLGQNFLTSQKALKQIIKAADVHSDDLILEIGPGIGVLTKALSRKAKKIIAVEKDSRLVKVLNKTLSNYNNIKIIEKDFLEFDLKNLKNKNFKVVGALPYSVATAIIRKILEESSPDSVIITLQKEVAERIVADPPNMSMLAVAVQFYGNPEIVSSISSREFWPQPKVNSCVLKINNILPLDHKLRKFDKKLFKLVKAGFAHPRKKLINSLELRLKPNKEKLKKTLNKANIDPKRRAETLTVNEWIKLVQNF